MALNISSEKSDSINPCGDVIKKILPMIMNKNEVKINEMDIKVISNLLFMLSLF